MAMESSARLGKRLSKHAADGELRKDARAVAGGSRSTPAPPEPAGFPNAFGPRFQAGFCVNYSVSTRGRRL